MRDVFVEFRARVSNDRAVLLRPCGERHDRIEKGPPGSRQSVVDPRWCRRCHRPSDESVALEAAKRQREHSLRDPIDRAAKLVEAHRAIAKDRHDENAPLVADPFEHVANRAVVVGNLRVPSRHGGAFLRREPSTS